MRSESRGVGGRNSGFTNHPPRADGREKGAPGKEEKVMIELQ